MIVHVIARHCRSPTLHQANEPALLVVVNGADCYIVPKYYVLPFFGFEVFFVLKNFSNQQLSQMIFIGVRGVIQMLEVVVIVLMEW